jgi:hypothetical protein
MVLQQPANAWTGLMLGGKSGIALELTRTQRQAFDELLAKSRRRLPQELTRSDFDHPEVLALAASLDDVLRRGRGVVLLAGLNCQNCAEQDMERIYWGIGTLLGEAAVQSPLGDRLGHVRDVPQDPIARGYRSAAELPLHTDLYPVVGLMCLQRAESGGLSTMVSSLAIHNELLRTRPDLLEPLYEGYYFALVQAQGSGHTSYKIPVFHSECDVVTCGYSRALIERAAEMRREALPWKLAEALQRFDELAGREDLALRFRLEPGEMLFWANFQMVHARDAYQDSAVRTRHLLRLWLKVQNDWPVAPELRAYARDYEQLFGGPA